MTSATFVKRARLRMGKTQEELAKLLELTRWTVIRYEQGEPLPKTVRLAIIHLLTQFAVGREIHGREKVRENLSC